MLLCTKRGVGASSVICPSSHVFVSSEQREGWMCPSEVSLSKVPNYCWGLSATLWHAEHPLWSWHERNVVWHELHMLAIIKRQRYGKYDTCPAVLMYVSTKIKRKNEQFLWRGDLWLKNVFMHCKLPIFRIPSEWIYNRIIQRTSEVAFRHHRPPVCGSISLQLNAFRFTCLPFQTAFESPTDVVRDYTTDNI